MEVDAVVLGPRMVQGTMMEFSRCKGVVRFMDDSVEDDKYLFYVDGFYSIRLLSCYFSLYAIFKRFLYFTSAKKRSNCRFLGIEHIDHDV